MGIALSQPGKFAEAPEPSLFYSHAYVFILSVLTKTFEKQKNKKTNSSLLFQAAGRWPKKLSNLTYCTSRSILYVPSNTNVNFLKKECFFFPVSKKKSLSFLVRSSLREGWPAVHWYTETFCSWVNSAGQVQMERAHR